MTAAAIPAAMRLAARSRPAAVAVAASPQRRPLHTRAPSLTTAYNASAYAAATLPLNAHKPVKEVRSSASSVDLANASTGAEVNDATLSKGVAPSGNSMLPYLEMRIIDVLKRKAKFGSTLHTIAASAKITEAMQTMHAFNIGAILVTDDGNPSKIVGILSTRDFIKHVTEEGVDPRSSLVRTMMSPNPVYAFSDSSALSCMEMMQAGGFRHLPVRDRSTGKTVGVISIGDLVREMLKTFREKNEFL